MYRAITAKALAAGVGASNEKGLVDIARRTELAFTPDGLMVDGRAAGLSIRTLEVNRAVSEVSAHPGVRSEMVRQQREIMRHGGIVAEGRDIGTVVYPEASVKIFLIASIRERARRRLADHADAGETVSISDLEADIARRDHLDSTRAHSPLAPADDAIVLDTTVKTPDEVIAEIVALARAVERAEA